MVTEKEELQRDWDRRLISGWYQDKYMNKLVGFFLHFNGIEVENDEVIAAFKGLELKRMPTFIGDLNRPVKSFISKCCPRLSGCLFDKRHSAESILDVIELFEWNSKGSRVTNPERANEKRVERNLRRATRFIPSRGLSKKHDWGTVK